MHNPKNVAKKFIKKMSRTFLDAFELGYADGRAGRIKKLPEIPAKEDDIRVYALCIFVRELYKDGFEAGKSVRRYDEST